jgi:hypothetical protein
MHAFKFSLIAALSCIAMTGATAVGNSGSAKDIARREENEYVPYSQLRYMEVLTSSKKSFSSTCADNAAKICTFCVQVRDENCDNLFFLTYCRQAKCIE